MQSAECKVQSVECEVRSVKREVKRCRGCCQWDHASAIADGVFGGG